MDRLFLGFFVFLSLLSLDAQTAPWQPSAGHKQLPIWPGAVPDEQSVPGPEFATFRPGCFPARSAGGLPSLPARSSCLPHGS